MRRNSVLLLLAIGLCATPGSARADEAKPGEESKPAVLLVTAKEIESPILKYRLHPTEPELVEGDAAPILLRLPWEQSNYFLQEIPKLERWVTLPLDHPDWQESKGVLPARFYGELKRAAFRRDAHWNYPLREEPFYEILLPDLQGARALIGQGLSAKIRYHIRNGEFELAHESLAVGLGVTRHYGRTPFIITQLVVAAVQRMMLDRVAEVIAAEGSPNLYWALSSLPRPLIDLRPSLELEVRALEMTIPELADLDRPRDADAWKSIGLQLVRVIQMQTSSGGLSLADLERRKLKWIDLAVKELPQLTGASKDDVAAMADEETAIRWFVWHHRRHVERAAAIQTLRPREAFPQLIALKQDMADFAEKSGIPSGAVFDPLNVYVAIWSIQRRVDALRVVEAIRHYAATHGGKLPEKLDDVADAPIPTDPLTDKPFQWKLVDGLGVLTAPDVPGVEHPTIDVEHQVRIR